MYQQQRSGWLKHWDFAILDVICFEIAFLLSLMIRQYSDTLYSGQIYRQMGILLVVFPLVSSFVAKPYSGILRRDFLQELFAAVSFVSSIMGFLLVFLFLMKSSETYSRMVVFATWGLAVVFVHIARVVRRKAILHNRKHTAQKRAVALLVGQENAVQVYQQLTQNKYAPYEIAAIVVQEESIAPTLEEACSVPFVYGNAAAISFFAQNVVDELFVHLPGGEKPAESFINACRNAGITIHLGLVLQSESFGKQSLEKFGDYYVLTSSIRVITPMDAIAKRVMDICGALVGLVLTAVVALFVGPAIYLASPGPIIFSQMRVGRNGRPFKFYKFRSMYMDAEARKAELMSQNKMSGLMFKIDNDPRIIKGVGHFIRKTSLDEFPQFWNVLRGDMSLVGTRPPTLQEYAQYELNHKSRLAFKPGITGLWQISGRSDIVDFNEVIRLDTTYIETWTIAEDIRILVKTVLTVLKQKGSE